MKTTTQILTLLLTVFLSSQILFGQESKAVVDGFWGIKFGSSVTDARKIILAKKTGTIDEKESSKNHIVIMEPEFAGKKTLQMALQFVDDKFHTGKVFFYPNLKPFVGSESYELYKEVKKDLDEKYYKTNRENIVFESPYSNGDGYEALAIKSGKAKVAASWSFKQNDGNEITILLELVKVNENLIVALFYQDEKLFEQASQKQKNANAEDF